MTWPWAAVIITGIAAVTLLVGWCWYVYCKYTYTD